MFGTHISSLSRLQIAVAMCCSTHKLYVRSYNIVVDEETLHLSSPKPSGKFYTILTIQMSVLGHLILSWSHVWQAKC
ncbi:hypothetical protein VNO77_19108 [Canavalia gladiata]|uniref:Uncharacterized protein n=1 Tax=Canavalia gladiata TaxID=3824 RepID=A0AAN9LQY8_CANGL